MTYERGVESRYVVAMLALMLAFAPLSAASESDSALKARYLFSFLKFMDWPDSSLAEIRLCTLGNTDVNSPLSQYHQSTANGHSVVVDTAVDVNRARSCQLLFISQSSTEDWRAVIHELKNNAVVTVADIEGFSYRGGMIEFIEHHHRLRFMINQEVAQAKSVKVDSKLLFLGF